MSTKARAPAAKSTAHPTEDEHRSVEQAHWIWQRRTERRRDVLAYLTFAVSVVAFTAAALGFWQSFRQANTAAEQTEILRLEFELSQRPWLSVKQLRFVRPLVFDERGASATISLVSENTGHSPAINIWAEMRAFPYDVGRQIIAEQKSLCSSRQRKPVGIDGLGFILFPGASMEAPIPFLVRPADIARGIASSTLPSQIGTFPLYIVGCLDYAFPFKAEHHQTPFVFEIDKVDPTSPNGFIGISPADKEYSPEQLVVLTNPRAGGSAN